MASNKRLKAFVRFDGIGRVIPGSLNLQANKPKVGNWQEIDAYECCNPTTSTTTTIPVSTTTTTSNPGYYTWTVYFGESALDACGQTTPSTVYTSGPDFTGSTLYTDTALTTPITPSSGYLALNTPGGKFSFEINGSSQPVSPVGC